VEAGIPEDDPRPDWDRLNDGFSPNPIGFDMKASLRLDFEGTFDAFVRWMEETFKSPHGMPLTVTVNSLPLVR
jgi:hypothetical protein